MTIYTRLALTEPEFKLLRGLLSGAETKALARIVGAKDAAERAFYEEHRNECAALLRKFDGILAADRSDDAEPDDEDSET